MDIYQQRRIARVISNCFVIGHTNNDPRYPPDKRGFAWQLIKGILQKYKHNIDITRVSDGFNISVAIDTMLKRPDEISELKELLMEIKRFLSK